MYNIIELEERLNAIQMFKSVAVTYNRNYLIVSIITTDNFYYYLAFNECENAELNTMQLFNKIMRSVERMC